MGTRAITKISDEKHDIVLYTRWDGFEEEIKKDIHDQTKMYQGFIDEVSKRIKGKEAFFPLLSRWVGEMQTYLETPNTAKKVATLLSAKSFHHHHLERQNGRQADVEEPDVYYRVHKNDSRKTKIKQVKCEAPVRAVALVCEAEDGDEIWIDGAVTSATAQEIGYDVKDISRFWLELTWLLHLDPKEWDTMDKIPKEGLLFDFYSSNISRINGLGAPWREGRDRRNNLVDLEQWLCAEMEKARLLEDLKLEDTPRARKTL
jgi:hypothetical protein